MIFQRQTRRSSSRRVLLVTIGIALVLLVLQLVQMPVIGRVLQPVAVPLLKIRTGLAHQFPTIGGWFSTKSSLIKENELLQAELQRAYEERIALQANADRFTALTTALGLATSTGERIIAPIISKPPFAAYDTLLIARGTSDGVTEGMRVFSDQGQLGTIVTVYPRTAVVELLSKPGATYEVLVGTSTRLSLEGTGGGTFYARVPQGVLLGTSTPVVLPGRVPTLIGSVVEETNDPADAFKNVYIQAPANLSRIEYVFVDE